MAWFSGNLLFGEFGIYTIGGVVYDSPPSSMRRTLIGASDTTWRIGRASNEFEVAISINTSSIPIGAIFGRYDGPFINLYSSEVKIGIYQRMFLLAPEDRQVTPYTIMAGNYGEIISPWYRQYLNLGF